jgi:hypothetical protein
VDDSETVTRTEFAAGLKELGYKTSARKLDHIMGELDIDKDGAVTFVEFMRPTAKKYKEEEELENVGLGVCGFMVVGWSLGFGGWGVAAGNKDVGGKVSLRERPRS